MPLDVDEEPAVDVVAKMGADYLVVSSDYPHSDGGVTAFRLIYGLRMHNTNGIRGMSVLPYLEQFTDVLYRRK